MPDLGHWTPEANKNAPLIHRWSYGACRVSTVFFHVLKSAFIPTAPEARISTSPPPIRRYRFRLYTDTFLILTDLVTSHTHHLDIFGICNFRLSLPLSYLTSRHSDDPRARIITGLKKKPRKTRITSGLGGGGTQYCLIVIKYDDNKGFRLVNV